MRLNMLKKEGFITMPTGGSDFLSTIGQFFQGPGLMIVMMEERCILPQKVTNASAEFKSIKVGDRVRTIGGIYGTVTNIKDDIITISVGPDKARLVFARGAIANVEDVAVENTMEESNSK